jgi:hypothetical protein
MISLFVFFQMNENSSKLEIETIKTQTHKHKNTTQNESEGGLFERKIQTIFSRYSNSKQSDCQIFELMKVEFQTFELRKEIN